MSAVVIEGRPADQPDVEPLRLKIDPGSATADEIAELLSAISNLSVCMGGESVVWTMPEAKR